MGDSHSTRGFWCVKIETASTELCSPQSGLLYSSVSQILQTFFLQRHPWLVFPLSFTKLWLHPQTLLISSPRPLPHPSSEAAGKPQEEWRLFISQESSSWGGGGASGRKLLRVGGASFLQGDALRWPPLPTRKVSHKSLALLWLTLTIPKKEMILFTWG